MKFNRLSFISLGGKNKHGQTMWNVRCDCGTECVKSANDVKRGDSKSCGCLHRERTSAARKHHGKSGGKDKLYRTWLNVRRRCLSPNFPKYRDYGGRGILICERWESFELFASDMGEPPSGAHSIDRIDNNGNYEPSNCRWATKKQQALNRRNRAQIQADRAKEKNYG